MKLVREYNLYYRFVLIRIAASLNTVIYFQINSNYRIRIDLEIKNRVHGCCYPI